MDDSIRIEYSPLDELRRHPRNPKDHDTDAIRRSIQRFGYIVPILIDERTGWIVAGHGRLDSLSQLRDAQAQPPKHIRVRKSDGQWLVPVTRGISFNSDQEVEAYLIADNQLTIAGGWKTDELASILVQLNDTDPGLREATGFGQDALDKLLADLDKAAAADRDDEGGGAEGGDTEPDRVALAAANWNVRPGDIWSVGRHRLMCGDATSQSDYNALMGGNTPAIMVTDPPYGVNYDPTWRDDALGQFTVMRGKVYNDHTPSWLPAWQLFQGDVAYIWHSSLKTVEVITEVIEAGYELRNLIIWNKQHFTITRGHYHWKHEPCVYAVRKGKAAHWIGDRTQTTVWDISSLNITGKSAPEEKTGHGTQKPVECMARPIRNHTGDVYDPFCGSGSTLVACENLQRRGYAMEIDPDYCGVILERLAKKGLKPERIVEGNGRPAGNEKPAEAEAQAGH